MEMIRLNKKEDNSLDILKFIGSLFVMAIHLNLLGEENIRLYPWLGLAVPSFFIISGYLLTMKLLKNTNYFWGWFRKNYIQYLKYTTFFFPFVIYEWFKNGESIFELLRNILWGRSIGAYWYVVAILFGGVILYLLIKGKIGNKQYKVMLILSILSMIITAISGSYSYLAPHWGRVINCFFIFITGGSAYISFVTGISFMLIGAVRYCRRERKFFILKTTKKSGHAFIMLSLLFFCYCEWIVIQRNGGKETVCSGLISFIPSCIYFFELALLYDKKICLPFLSFRELSKIIYFCHVPIGTILGFGLHKVFHRNMNTVTDSIFRYLCTLIICYIIYLFKTGFRKYKRNECGKEQ